jgi:hypothetical protein
MIGRTFWKTNIIAANYCGKNDWQYILGKNMIAAHSGKNQDYQHILGKKHDWQHILLQQNLIESTFWEKI